MANFDTGVMTATLAELVDKDVRPQFQRSHIMFNKFLQTTGKEINERGRFRPVYLRPSTGGAPAPEGFAMPLPTNPTEAQFKVVYTTYYWPFAFTAQSLAQMEQGSSYKKVKDRMREHRENMQVDLNQHFYYDGTGKKAVVDTANGAINQATSTFYCATDPAAGYTFGNKHLRVGMKVSFHSGSAYRQNGGSTTFVSTISSLGTDGLSVTCDDIPSDLADGDLVVPAGLDTSTGTYNRFFTGLESHVGTSGTYQNLSRSTYPELKAIVEDMNGAPLGYGTFSLLNDAVLFRRDAGKETSSMDLVILGPGQWNRRHAMFNSFKRASMQDDTLRMGAKKMTDETGFEVTVDPHCPEDTVYRLRPQDFETVTLAPLDFVDTGNANNMILQNATAFDGTTGHKHAYSGWLYTWFNTVGLEPRNQIRIHDLELPALRAKDRA